MESGSGIKQIQPNSYNKQINLLPGSDERKAKLVNSLEELKSQMDKDNKESDLKTRTINKYIIVTSIGIAATLLLSNKSNSKKDKGESDIKKLIKTIFTVLSIGGMIKGISGMGNSYVEVIERNSNIKLEKDKTYSSLNSIKNKKQDLFIELASYSVIDLSLKLGLMSKTDVKSTARVLKYKKASGITGKVIDEILSYEYK
jgi:hypothetical protein